MTRGVLLLALGHPNYGRMAHNLAASIKHNDPDIAIALGYAGDALDGLYGNMSEVFDSMFEVPKESYQRSGSFENEWIMAKAWMYDLSPFDHTIFMDVDTIVLPGNKLSNTFDDLEGIGYTMANRDFITMGNARENYSMWCNTVEVKAAWGFDDDAKYYSIHSEFVYFEKSDKNKAFFDTVKECFLNPKVNAKQFANSIPDELAFALAQMVCNQYPHQSPYLPGYWGVAERQNPVSDGQLYHQYVYLSIGGKLVDNRSKERYNRLSKVYATARRATDFYKYKDKSSFLLERQAI